MPTRTVVCAMTIRSAMTVAGSPSRVEPMQRAVDHSHPVRFRRPMRETS